MIEYNEVLRFFISVLVRDQKLLLSIENADDNIKMKNGELVFSLNGLYLFLRKKQLISDNTLFSEFKKNLYGGQLNQELQKNNGVVEVYKSTSKINTSLYKLRVLID